MNTIAINGQIEKIFRNEEKSLSSPGQMADDTPICVKKLQKLSNSVEINDTPPSSYYYERDIITHTAAEKQQSKQRC